MNRVKHLNVAQLERLGAQLADADDHRVEETWRDRSGRIQSASGQTFRAGYFVYPDGELTTNTPEDDERDALEDARRWGDV